MKYRNLLPLMMIAALPAYAQTGEPYIHDPSTIVECDGKYYTYGTGEGGLMSDDGWTWRSGAVRPGMGAAPDAMKIGNRYLVIYGATGGGLMGGHNGRILTMWNNTMDPTSPDFKYYDLTEVANSNGLEDCDAIDPSLFIDPKTNRLWVTYGTYWGNIRQIELDPATGKRVAGNEPKDIAIDCEATDMIEHDGWYYLLGTHGTCCDGVNSTYNIVCGRSRSANGPFIDNVGRDMIAGGGKMVANAGDRVVGAGHFGRFIIDKGVEVMSCHWEADFDMSGRSTLGIRPLLWRNGWPKAGERFKSGVYEIESERRGYSLELATDFVRIPQKRSFWGAPDTSAVKPIPSQQLSDVEKTWPKGEIGIRCNDYMFHPNQHWNITPAEGKGGYLGNPYYKITIAGTERALAATANKELTSVPAYTGADEQLWRIEQLIDGTYRIMPKRIPGENEDNKHICIYSAGDSTPTLAEYDFESDNSKWNLKKQ